MNYHIELTRHNVTPARFFAYIRRACKAKGIDFCDDRDQFENPTRPGDSRYHVVDGQKICDCDGYRSVYPAEDAACKSEICRNLPYDCQVYILNWDGSCYNEIIEFTFDDDKTGHGYYYQANKDADQAAGPDPGQE